MTFFIDRANSLISRFNLTAEFAEAAETDAEKKCENEFFSVLLSDLRVLRGQRLDWKGEANQREPAGSVLV